MSDFLIYEQQGPVVTLTMNQPEQHNPLTGNTAVAEFLAVIGHVRYQIEKPSTAASREASLSAHIKDRSQ